MNKMLQKSNKKVKSYRFISKNVSNVKFVHSSSMTVSKFYENLTRQSKSIDLFR